MASEKRRDVQPLRADDLVANLLGSGGGEGFVERETDSLDGDVRLGGRVFEERALKIENW